MLVSTAEREPEDADKAVLAAARAATTEVLVAFDSSNADPPLNPNPLGQRSSCCKMDMILSRTAEHG